MIAFVVKGGIDLWSLEHVQNGTKIKWFFTSITSSKILSFCKGEWESRLDFTFPGLSSNSKSEGDAWDSAVVVNIHCPVRISISKEGLLGKVLSSIRNIMAWHTGAFHLIVHHQLILILQCLPTLQIIPCSIIFLMLLSTFPNRPSLEMLILTG